MLKQDYENELKRSLQDLREELDLIDTAIAALTRYREICGYERKASIRLVRLPAASSPGIRQAGS